MRFHFVYLIFCFVCVRIKLYNTMDNEILTLQKYVDESSRIVFFGGAGVSTESGIPDFRSEDGLYRQKYAVPPETILSDGYFYAHTKEFFAFYRDKMLCLTAKPNKAHKALAKWERQGKLLAVITQNIDGLHQSAGSNAVYELHGSVHRNRCLHCGKQFNAEFMLHSQGIPRCTCGGIVKPDVVLYGEPLNEKVVRGAVNAISSADLLIVAGTSLTVYPAASYVSYFCGKRLVLINKSETPLDNACDLVIHESVGEVLSRISV